jgi:hypothetical protein
MISPFDMWNRFSSYVNTYQGGFFRPSTDFERAANDINLELYNEKTKIVPRTQELQDQLYPFSRTKNVSIIAKDSYYGIALYPNDYSRFSSARILVDKGTTIEAPLCEKEGIWVIDEIEIEERKKKHYKNLTETYVDLIDDQRWGACLSHKTKKPTLERPKMTQVDDGFKVAPREISNLILTYYLEPKYVKFEYVKAPGDVQTGAGDQLIYTPGSPPQMFLWKGTMMDEFIIRLGERFGIFTRDQFMATKRR